MTPPLTVTATLQDIFGNVDGSVASPSKLSFTLCGFGPIQPRIAGTSVLARVGPVYVSSSNGAFSQTIWGNDQITPAGTYYAVEVIDDRGNVVQCDAYEFTGAGTVDLSNLTPILAPSYSTPSGYIRVPAATGAVTINSTGWTGPVTIDLTLTGNATITLVGFCKGQVVNWIIRQNSAGGYTVTFPSSVKNPASVSTVANSVSSQSMSVDYLLNLYPQNGWS